MKIVALLFAILLGTLVFPSCTEDPVSLTVKIYGQGAGYTGTYTIDNSEDDISFKGSETTSNVFLYTTTVEIADQIVIDIFPEPDEDDTDETDMTDLTCRIFNDSGSIVYETSYSISSALMKTFVYDLDDTVSTDDV